jgi:hypothetical protein
MSFPHHLQVEVDRASVGLTNVNRLATMSREEIMEAYLWQGDVFNKMKTVLHPTAEQDEADDDNVHDEGEGKSGRVTAKNIWSCQGNATSEESIALKRAQDLEKNARQAKRHKKRRPKTQKGARQWSRLLPTPSPFLRPLPPVASARLIPFK